MDFNSGFDLTEIKPCGSLQGSPIEVYPIEKFLNDGQVPLAVIDLGLTESDRQALDRFHIEPICELAVTRGLFCDETYMDGTKDDYNDHTKLYTAGYEYFTKHKSLKADPELMDHMIDLVGRAANKASLAMPENTKMLLILRTYSQKVQNSELLWHDHHNECNPPLGYTPNLSYDFLATLKGEHTLQCAGQYDINTKECIQDANGNGIFTTSFGTGTIIRTCSTMHAQPLINEQRLLIVGLIRAY